MKAILRKLFNDTNTKQIRELIRYGLVGMSTTLINLLTYHGLLFLLDYRIANLIALIASKIYGYFANKKIVFHSRTDSFRSFILEVSRFIFARGITALIDYFGLIIAVEVLHFDKILSKYIIQIIVIFLNYILGKFLVFRQIGEQNMENHNVQEYNTGNIEKYESKNSLKRKMVNNFHHKMLTIIKDIMDKDTPHILDAGCGEGFFTTKVQEALPSADIVGCDGAQEALDIAQKMCPNIHFEIANLYELPYADHSFDLVICSEVLEHLQDPSVALKELCRVGKKVLITVPHEPWFRLGNLLALHNVTRLGDPIDHINHWTFKGFEKFISSRVSQTPLAFDKSFPWSIFIGNFGK